MSSLELARVYTPAIIGLPKTHFSDELIKAHEEQITRKSLQALHTARTSPVLNKDQLSKGTKVYIFHRGPKFGTWKKGFVCGAETHFVLVSSNHDHSGKVIRAAYKDLRLTLHSSLFQALDDMDFIFPRSSGVLDEDFFPNYSLQTSNDAAMLRNESILEDLALSFDINREAIAGLSDDEGELLHKYLISE